MKIIDKIVTSITLPQQTNVLWHNPETGELKIFGNNGWEVAGGGTLPEIVESGLVLDKASGGVASRFTADKVPNTCNYQSRGIYAWVFYDDPGLVTGKTYELTEVGTDNKVSVVCLGNPGGPWSGSAAYTFEGDLDVLKVYFYGTRELTTSSTASGLASMAFGDRCIASSDYSIAVGQTSKAYGVGALSLGSGTTASSDNQYVIGTYNIVDNEGNYIFIIGNGPGYMNSNAFAVKWDGTIVLWKDVNTPLELTPDKLEKLLALVD